MNSLELEVKFLKEENEKLKECLENYNNSNIMNLLKTNIGNMNLIVISMINCIK